MAADTSRTGADPNTLDDRPRTKTRMRGVAPVEVPQGRESPPKIGRYEVVEVIGRGAMGIVYKARDPILERTIAIKTIMAPAQLGRNVRKAFLERFSREAKAAARISHPAIVTIFDVGVIEETEAPYLVMEYLPGETLADRLDRTRLPLAQAIQCARDLASALGCAHRERIVHRDVKPANVLHAGEQRWKLADFGIARMPDSDLTQVGIFMGTPGYAPPEAIREGRYTPQADVFAWGAVLYELLCARVPYEGPDTQTTNGYVLKAEPPSPRTYDPSVPELLAQVALRALAHDTKKRYKDGNDAEAALGEAWEKCLAQGLVPMSAFASATGAPGRGIPAPAPAQGQGPAATGAIAAAMASPPPPPPPAAAGKKGAPPKPPAQLAAPAAAAGRSETDGPTTLYEPGNTPRPVPGASLGGMTTDRVERSGGRAQDADKGDRLMVAAAVASAQATPLPAREVAEARVLRPEKRSAASLWLIVSLILIGAAAGAVALFLIMKG
jgi:serine/threonine-protein kinase